MRRVKAALFSVENSYGLLPDEMLNRGSNSFASSRITGSKDPGIPGGDALVFTTTGRIWVDDPYAYGDDPLPIVSTLCYYEDEWRKELRADPAKFENLSSAINFLIESIVWAAREYVRFAEFSNVVLRISGHLDSIVRNSERKLKANAPCFNCGGKLSKEYKRSKECVHHPKVEIESVANEEGWIAYGIDYAVKEPNETLVIDREENVKVYYLANWEPCGCDQGGLRFFWECDRCGTMYSDDEYFTEIEERIKKGNEMKSSHSANVGQCVQVAFYDNDVVRVWHTDNSLHVVDFTYAEWDAFVKGVKDGEFDAPTGEYGLSNVE